MDMRFSEYDDFRKSQQTELSKESDDDRFVIAHAIYIERVIKRKNTENKLLHDHWEPWARSVKFCGEEDWMAISRGKKDASRKRQQMIFRYGYAIPNETSLDVIAQFGQVLEVGSGSGYWAYLLRKKSVEVIALDNRVSCDSMEHDWFPDTVKTDVTQYLQDHDGCPDRALFMCWPNYDGDLVLKAYKGRNVIVVGEIDGRSCWEIADEDETWTLMQSIEIPVWPGMHDRMRIYKRANDDHKKH